MIAVRPQPVPTDVSAPFWSAARDRRLLLQHCGACGWHQFPPGPTCRRCGGIDIEWVEADGRAVLWSWTVCHPPLLPWFAERAPWTVAAVELLEGVRMVTTLAGVEQGSERLGLPLLADFDDLDDGTTLVVFRPNERPDP